MEVGKAVNVLVSNIVKNCVWIPVSNSTFELVYGPDRNLANGLIINQVINSADNIWDSIDNKTYGSR